MAIRSLFTNKLRSVLTMLGIIIGVGSVIALMSVGRGAQASILSPMTGLGTNVLAIVPTSGEGTGMAGISFTTPTLTLDDAKAIENAYGVEAIAPSNETFVQISANNEDKFAVIEGVTPEYLSVMNHTLIPASLSLSMMFHPEVWSWSWGPKLPALSSAPEIRSDKLLKSRDTASPWSEPWKRLAVP